MKRFLLLVAFVFAWNVGTAAPVPLAWDANPPDEQVSAYCLWAQTPAGSEWSEAVELWCGEGVLVSGRLTHTLDLDPGQYRLTATARTMWHNPPEYTDESEPSDPVETPKPVPSQVRNFRGEWVVIQVNVSISE